MQRREPRTCAVLRYVRPRGCVGTKPCRAPERQRGREFFQVGRLHPHRPHRAGDPDQLLIMAGDFALGDEFLSEVLGAAARDVAAACLPGSAVVSLLAEPRGVAFCRAAWGWLSKKTAAQRQDAITALARTPADRIRPAVEAGLAGIDCDPETRAQLVNYLTAIPMTARRAITRPNDGGRPATLLSQLPRSEADLLRFVPLRAPRFQPADRWPGHDYRVEALLGRAGFAERWKARHPRRG